MAVALQFIICVLSALLVNGGVVPTKLQVLPLTGDDIGLSSQKGLKLFSDTKSIETFLKLSEHFVTQANQGFCGPASSVMVLNALNASMSISPEYKPYTYWTQHAWVETSCVKSVIGPKFLGMTLMQVHDGMRCQQVRSRVIHASNSSEDELRQQASKALAAGKPVIANFNRSDLGEEGYGHFSPLAAYHAESDRFLMLDVARYKYPPAWVTTKALFRAMNTADMASLKSRGYIIVEGVEGE